MALSLVESTHRMNGTLSSFMECKAANSPCKSHHLLAMAWNLRTSAGSTVFWETVRTF